jgi:EpsI family protein
MGAVTRSAGFFALTVGVLAVTGALLIVPSPAREVPLPAPLDALPASFDGWVGADVPTSPLPVDPQGAAHLRRAYRDGAQTVWVAVSYYPHQSEGYRPPAVELLYPNRGWNWLSEETVRIPLGTVPARSIRANLVVINQRGDYLVTLYWYQVQTHSIASDHWYRVVLLYNRLVHQRAEGAFVRVAALVTDGAAVGAVVDQEKRFVQAFYPELLRSLPR